MDIIMVALRIPKKLREKLAELGLDVESEVIEKLFTEARLDPVEEAEARLELAERFLEGARGYVERGDAVQASAKLYKVAEECVKALATKFNAPELEESRRRGRWMTWLLGRAARTLAEKLGEPKIEFIWGVAYDLHVWGFHEAKYGVDMVRVDVPHLEWLLNHAKKIFKE